MNTVAAELASDLQGVPVEEIQKLRFGLRAKSQSTSQKRNLRKNLARNRGTSTNSNRLHRSPPSLVSTFLKRDRLPINLLPRDRLSGLRSTDWVVHRAGCSPSRFGRCPYQSSLGMAAFASSEVDGGNRWKAPAPEPAMVDIVVEGTAAADTAADRNTATPGFVAARVFGCIVPVQQSKAPGRREGIGSGNNPNRHHASANTPPPGSECASCSRLMMMADLVAWRREPRCRLARAVGTASFGRVLRAWVSL